MILTLAVLTGFFLDLVFADPVWIPHPVVLMGKCISKMERILRDDFSGVSGEKERDRADSTGFEEKNAGRMNSLTPGGEFIRGAVLAVFLPLSVFFLSLGICRLCLRIHPALYFAMEAFWCYQALAAKGLANEAFSVSRVLKTGNLEAAREQVSRIVGRDTKDLDEAGVIRASVETVAENSSDGVTAPLFYMLTGGAPLALAYKAINTMDSMIGYRNEQYLYFGRAAARLDDAANFLPSRITAMFWIAAAFFDSEADGRHAWKIFRRDRYRHSSPNSAQTESACAGALHIRLAGPASYFGKKVNKPWIGDDDRPVEAEDIRRSVRLMWISCLLALIALAGLRCLILLIIG